MARINQTKETILKVEQPAELMKFLIDELPKRGRNAIKGILSRGQVSINRQETTQFDHALKPGDLVNIVWNKVLDHEKPTALTILHEDEDIIVIHKEAGLLSIAGGKETELTAHRQLNDYVRKLDPKGRIYVVHRLDRDTSGVMVFAKNEKAKLTLQNNWQDMVFEKSYVALVEKKVKKQKGTIKSWLKESKTLLMYSSPYPNGGQEAITHYHVMDSTNDYSLLEIQLETGRKNQIRVHMQDMGHPIVGDKKYGSKIDPIRRLGLHAKTLEFLHPTTGKNVRFESQVPKYFLRFFG